MTMINNHLDTLLAGRQNTSQRLSFMAPAQSAEEKARASANEFESFFLYQMLELTDPGAPEGTFGGGFAEEAFRRVRNEEVAKEITKAGGIGLADTIYNQLIQSQEIK